MLDGARGKGESEGTVISASYTEKTVNVSKNPSGIEGRSSQTPLWTHCFRGVGDCKLDLSAPLLPYP